MWSDRFLSHWRGILLSLIGVVAICWLALTGRLGLYIHPRYFAFTVIMAVLAGAVILLAFVLVPGREDHEHDHDHDHGHGASGAEGSRSRRNWVLAGQAALLVGTAVALLVLPPATLTTTTVQQRDINGALAVGELDSAELAGADYSGFTVKDWATIIRTGSTDFLSGKTPTLVGFITPDTDDPDDVFYVARFAITCCAVDAQPIGVPVYLPGWKDRFGEDQWVSVTGAFVPTPGGSSVHELVIDPASVEPVDVPADPYVY